MTVKTKKPAIKKTAKKPTRTAKIKPVEKPVVLTNFENKKTAIKGDNKKNVYYIDLVNMGLNFVVSGGMNAKTMGAIVDFQKVVNRPKPPRIFKLTPENIEVVKLSVQAMEGRWTVLSEEIIEFIECVNSI